MATETHEPVVAIDFGTSFSSGAVVLDGGRGTADRVVVLKEPASRSTSLPSAVFLDKDGRLLVGTAAENAKRRAPDRFRDDFKRDLGRESSIPLGEASFSVEQIVAAVLAALRAEAAELAGEEIRAAVLTVPAGAGEVQRQALCSAAELAGFDPEQMTVLDEPVAAAFAPAAGAALPPGELVLVYDFGGGTFDAALIRVGDDGMAHTVIDQAGLVGCGGHDIDRLLYADILAAGGEEARTRLTVDPDSSDREQQSARRAQLELIDMTRRIKHHLSDADTAGDYFDPAGLDYEITRERFHSLVEPLLRQSVACCTQLLDRNDISPEQVGVVLLVGGTTRLPLVADLLVDALGRPLRRAEDPELAVAHGAAIHHLATRSARLADGPLVVDAAGSGDFSTISQAIAAAPPDGKILVKPGVYRESVTVDKPLQIRGEVGSSDVVLEAGVATVVRFLATTGRVSNLTIRQRPGKAAGPRGTNAAVRIASGTLDLEDCDVMGHGPGIAMVDAGVGNVRRCRVHGGHSVGVLLKAARTSVVEDCDIHGNRLAGVEIRDGAGPTVRHNRIHDGAQGGILVHDRGGGLLEDNDIYSNQLVGVEITTSGNPTLRRNRIHDGGGSGVLVHEDGRGLLEDNDISANRQAGVEIRTKGHPTLRNNRIRDGLGRGVLILEGGRGILSGNEITGNKQGGLEIKVGGAPDLLDNKIEGNKGIQIYGHTVTPPKQPAATKAAPASQGTSSRWGLLVIRRKPGSVNDVGGASVIQVFVDDVRQPPVDLGQTRRIKISPGTHKIRFRQWGTWSKELIVQLAAAHAVTITCSRAGDRSLPAEVAKRESVATFKRSASAEDRVWMDNYWS